MSYEKRLREIEEKAKAVEGAYGYLATRPKEMGYAFDICCEDIPYLLRELRATYRALVDATQAEMKAKAEVDALRERVRLTEEEAKYVSGIAQLIPRCLSTESQRVMRYLLAIIDRLTGSDS